MMTALGVPLVPKKEFSNEINEKFAEIFGARKFKGHNAYLVKQLHRMRLTMMRDIKRGSKSGIGRDFAQIHAYRHMVNVKVLGAIEKGVFEKAKTLN
mmetsp:Transcript_33263/g.51017  ORF Transcript_33263/g.51017 Transcript_33263/m.51017 type:complete len:97 (+) Transcript_33263:245-535(+)